MNEDLLKVLIGGLWVFVALLMLARRRYASAVAIVSFLVAFAMSDIGFERVAWAAVIFGVLGSLLVGIWERRGRSPTG